MKVSELWAKLQQVHVSGPDEEIGGGGSTIATATFTPATYATGGIDISAGAPSSVTQIIATVEGGFVAFWPVASWLVDIPSLKVSLFFNNGDELDDALDMTSHGGLVIRVLYIGA